MYNVHLLLSQEAEIFALMTALSNERGLVVRGEASDLYRLEDAMGRSVLKFSRGKFGWMASVGLVDSAFWAEDLARRARVRMLRLFFSGKEARTAAIYSWWGPEVCEGVSRVERCSEDLSLQVRSVYRAGVVEKEESVWSEPEEESFQALSVEVIPVPPKGIFLEARRVRGFLDQVQRAVQMELFGDPVLALLGLSTTLDLD